MAYLVGFPMQRGGTVVVAMDDEQLAGFSPAAASPGEVAAQASESFEAAVDKLLPAVSAVGDRMKAAGARMS
jgi:hypothetical protein